MVDYHHPEDTVRYRTESFSGLQERDAAEVMAFETFTLGNTDILECIRDTMLSGNPVCETINAFIDGLDRNGYVDDMPILEQIDFFHKILEEIKKATCIEVNYVLWLADKSTVQNFYGKYMTDENDYDAYQVGPVILSDLGYDGTLYGYTELPEPLTEQEISLIAGKNPSAQEKPSLSLLIETAKSRALSKTQSKISEKPIER